MTTNCLIETLTEKLINTWLNNQQNREYENIDSITIRKSENGGIKVTLEIKAPAHRS